MTKVSFSDFFKKATHSGRFGFQERFAQELCPLVNIPTGLGKTAMIVLGWLWRRFGGETARCDHTPRRLVYCLPMRVLVEQTRDNAISWLYNLGLLGGLVEFEERDEKKTLRTYAPDFGDPAKVTVHVLMGGEETEDWDVYPERNAILIGTQDMLLSRALNRGYGASRARWPMQFGLLHTDCLWVFDEIQLMGSGLATTTQLEALRRLLPHKEAATARDAHGCRSVWMSATLDKTWLGTVDAKDFIEDVPLLKFDFCEEMNAPGLDNEARENLTDRWNAKKPLRCARAKMGDHEALATEIVEVHAEHKGRTLVVVNTVRRACELFGSIQEYFRVAPGGNKRSRKDAESTDKDEGPRPKLVLLHSRFRPQDRKKQIDDLLDEPPLAGTICISTQVVEAGVDVDATTLFTELAPWASVIQRFGRCNRRGKRNDIAQVFWIRTSQKAAEAEKLAPPYGVNDLNASARRLAELTDVGINSLRYCELPFVHKHVIRRRDLIDLFDTTTDLAGNDIDIDRYVREVEETDVRVFWRIWDQTNGSELPPDEKAWRRVRRQELCPVPIGEFKQFADAAKRRGKIWCWDFLEGRWTPANSQSIYPGRAYLLHASVGGYDRNWGWVGAGGNKHVPPLERIEADRLSDDSYDDDALSGMYEWRTIAEHTDEVCHVVHTITEELPLIDAERMTLGAAARWHDWGKIHPAFVAKLKPEVVHSAPLSAQGRRAIAKAPDQAWLSLAELRKSSRDPSCAARPHFRHELASALGVLLPETRIGDVDRDLVAYLIAAHHGKVRLSIQSLPSEVRPDGDRRFARGVWSGDTLVSTDLGRDENGTPIISPDVQLSLEPMEMGLCGQPPFEGQPSWLERMLSLRDRLGIFRLAYLEALLRAADWRASRVAERAQCEEPTPSRARRERETNCD